jgi:hypothetical protein
LIPYRYHPGDKVFIRGISETQQVRVMAWEIINGWPYYILAGIDYPVIQQRLSSCPIVAREK